MFFPVLGGLACRVSIFISFGLFATHIPKRMQKEHFEFLCDGWIQCILKVGRIVFKCLYSGCPACLTDSRLEMLARKVSCGLPLGGSTGHARVPLPRPPHSQG